MVGLVPNAMAGGYDGGDKRVMGTQLVDKIIHRPVTSEDREKINRLDDGVLLVEGFPVELSTLIDGYDKESRMRDAGVLAPGDYSILAVGPLLDSIDEVVDNHVCRLTPFSYCL